MRAGFIEEPYRAYFKEVEEPRISSPDEVKIRVKFSGICGSELHAYHGVHPYRIPPLVSGHEFSGVITETGPAATRFKPGDRVTVEPHVSCGQCIHCREGHYNRCRSKRVLGATYWSGSFGEYVVVPEQTVVPLPDGISFEQGALIEPLAVGMHAVRACGVSPASKVFVAGGGAIGMGLIMCAKLFNPAMIITSATKEYNLRIASELGSTHVVAAANQEESVLALTDGVGADITFLAFGSPEMVATAVNCTRCGGIISEIAIMSNGLGFPYSDVYSKEVSIIGSNMYTREDYELVVKAISDGSIDPGKMITKVFPVEEMTAAMNFCDKRVEPKVKVLLRF